MSRGSRLSLFGAIPPWFGSGLPGVTPWRSTYRYRAPASVRAAAAAKKRGRRLERNVRDQERRIAGTQSALYRIKCDCVDVQTPLLKGEGWFRDKRLWRQR